MSNGDVAAPPPASAENQEDGSNRSQGQPVAGRRKMVKPKMDFAKALSIMGFSTSRTLDPSGFIKMLLLVDFYLK